MNPVVLVFGGTGWIGNKVVTLLQNLNVKVVISLCRGNDLNMIQREISQSMKKGINLMKMKCCHQLNQTGKKLLNIFLI